MRRGMDRTLTRLKRACLGLTLILGAVAAALSTYIYTSTADPVDEITAVITAVARESVAVSQAYLTGAEIAATTAADLSSNVARSSEDRLALLHSTVQNNPSLDAAFFGYPNGDFEFVAISLENPSGFRTRVIRNARSADRTVTVTERDADFTVLHEDAAIGDDFDPTGRPWWTGVASRARPMPYWTEAYTFASSGEPGVTHARPLLGADSTIEAVVGVDVRLTGLVAFLEGRAPNQGGSAHIFDANAALVASSQPGTAVPARLQELASSRSASSIPSLDATDPVQDIWTHDGATMISAVTAVGVKSNWTLVVSAPTDGFLTGFRSSLSRVRGAVVALGGALTLVMALAAWWLLSSLGKLYHDATTDPLTGLLNRAEAKRRLDQLLSRHRPGNTMLIAIADLDNFKLVNDQLGHRTGDMALVAAARFFDRGVGNRGFVSRLGGDEFLLVLHGSGRSVEFVLHEVMRGLQQALRPVIADPNIPPVTASCGYLLHVIDEPAGSPALMRRADIALLNAKLTRDACVQFTTGMTLPRSIPA